VSLISHQKGRDLPALYVRKERKEHGTGKLVEGDKSLFPGIRVVLLEDVITTGGSSLKAVRALEAVGAKVVGIAAIVDRLEGGADTIREAGLPLVSLTTRRDFIPED
jgi:orotate phosphoribosyltransferase